MINLVDDFQQSVDEVKEVQDAIKQVTDATTDFDSVRNKADASSIDY